MYSCYLLKHLKKVIYENKNMSTRITLIKILKVLVGSLKNLDQYN